MNIMQPLAAVATKELWLNGCIGPGMSIGLGVTFGLLITSLILVIFARHSETGFWFGLITMALGVFAAFVSFAIGGIEGTAEREKVTNARVAYFAERGITVTPKGLLTLDMPNYAPQKDQKFGIAQGEVDGKIVSFRAELTNGELKVYSTDGQELHPVKEKR